jgi:hypothetical protein
MSWRRIFFLGWLALFGLWIAFLAIHFPFAHIRSLRLGLVALEFVAIPPLLVLALGWGLMRLVLWAAKSTRAPNRSEDDT